MEKKMKRKIILLFLGILLMLTACMPQPTQDPGLLFTVVASTQTAAAWQTQMAEAAFTKTLTPPVLRPTFTPFPTMTSFVYELTASPTLTPTPTMTSTPPILESWPEWSTGENVVMPQGSGENIGVNRRFNVLIGVDVLVVRKNGVKLRSAPNKAIPGPLEESGAAFTLTGIMNRNKQYDWFFAQVIAADGNKYWVGGSWEEETDPRNSFIFYYPFLTPSATPSLTETATPID